jgi:hypothetical protein
MERALGKRNAVRVYELVRGDERFERGRTVNWNSRYMIAAS